jgi:hypothetical protein
MSCKRAKAGHDCTKDVAVKNASFLNYLPKCRGDCSPFHANLLAFVIAHSALQSILDADGPEMARGALKVLIPDDVAHQNEMMSPVVTE